MQWEFNKDLDTAKSYQAFIIYRDLGSSRSLEAAYQLHKGLENSPKTVPGFFKVWSSKGEWVSRAVDFDLENDRRRLEAKRASAHTEHDAKIEAMRNVLEQTAFLQLNTSYRLAQLIAGAIGVIYQECQVTIEGKVNFRPTQDHLKALLLISRLKSLDAAAIGSVIQVADQALGIQALIDQLKQD